jgi:hypothetical protein
MIKQKPMPKELKRGGTMKQNGNGHINQSLPGSNQFLTRSCARCAGLLVSEWSYDLDNAGAYRVETLRCVQCGNRIDPVILQNQFQLSVEPQSIRQQMWAMHPMNAVLLDEVA